MAAESDLYAPVKSLLEGQGYVVKGEVKGCDLVGVRGGDAPVVVELKRAFGLTLVLQGVNRLALTDLVYLAVGAWPKRMREVRKLCRRLGLGLLVVQRSRVEIVLDPVPYRPRRNARRTQRMLGEHARRVGDPNRGGSSTRVPIMTAYRQEALRCAALLAKGPMRLADMREADVVPNAARILQQDVYGWFQRVARGTYELSPQGHAGLARFGWTDATPGPRARPNERIAP